MIRRYLPKNVSDLVHWYERYISPLALVAGFIADNYILLRRVDLFRSNALLLSYLVIAAIGIVLINMIEGGRVKRPFMLTLAPIIPVVVQFSIGGLFSGYLSLYSRSAGVLESWVFVVIVAAFLIGNERFMRLYTRFRFQVSLYFLVLFSFLIFFLPVVFHRIGTLMFLLSGIISLVLIAGFLYLLHLLVPAIEAENRTKVARRIAAIYLVFNVLYFTNLIPPLPLALKDAGVYHGVTRINDSYTFLAEPEPWYSAVFAYGTVIHTTPGETIDVFSAVFAPTGLSTTILHQWQYYDTVQRAWQTELTVQFAVNGGRDGGYRGYTAKSDLAAGKWRVNVLTRGGQILGRVSFTVIRDIQTPLLHAVTK